MFLSTPSGPPAKSVKNPLYPLVFIKIPQNPHFLGGGRVELRKPLHVECWEDVHCLGWRGIVECIYLYSIIVFFICEANPLHPKQCTDEEHSTWSGGQRATWLWYDTDLDWHRASARASEPQPHIFYFIINFLFSTFSFNNNLLFFYKKRWFYKYHKNTRK